MCARFYIDPDAKNFALEAARDMGLPVRDDTGTFVPSDIVPSKDAPALLLQEDSLLLTSLTWGYPDRDGKRLLINARAESAADRPTFRHGFASHRALFPASSFYEWNPQKEKFTFHVREQKSFFLCGFYDDFDGKRRFVILTRGANEDMRPVHERMPVIAQNAAEGKQFLASGEGAKALFSREGPALLGRTDYEQLSLF